EEDSRIVKLEAIVLDKDGSDDGLTSEVKWTSGNPKVATVMSVEHGEVLLKIHSAGTAVITATALDGSGKSGKVTLNVSNLVSNIAISGEETIQAGKSQAYTVQVSPVRANDKSVTWTVSSVELPDGLPDVQKEKYDKIKKPVTVSNGKLNVNKDVPSGTTITITAESKDGSYVKGTKTVTVQ
nr:Ig-like domain-containing protein [Lachnospiraceae bacterium]